MSKVKQLPASFEKVGLMGLEHGGQFKVRFKCNRCNHEWQGNPRRRTWDIPKQCPACRSPYWNSARKRDISTLPHIASLRAKDSWIELKPGLKPIKRG